YKEEPLADLTTLPLQVKNKIRERFAPPMFSGKGSLTIESVLEETAGMAHLFVVSCSKCPDLYVATYNDLQCGVSICSCIARPRK
ncbi:hypothetical protein, partial [Vibrio diazotrophicus]|uniref:hypothetical protein n=1 Tax=Vibrio diazotrophicus TaxID=685 RepID=UPI001C37E234